MALESAHGRIFELTPEKEIVWEYVFDHLPCGPRAYRYAWDHCPQLAALGRPDETPVAPPEGWRRRPV